MNQNNNDNNEGIVYVMTNVAIPGYVKIGRTKSPSKSSLIKRARALSRTSVPVAFEVYFAVKVNNAKKTEEHLHDAFADHRPNPKREFFKGIDAERVVSAMKLLLINGGEIVSLTEEDDSAISDKIDKEEQNKATISLSRYNLSEVGIEEGSELEFTRDSSIVVVVAENNQVYFKNDFPDGNYQKEDLMSLTAAVPLAFDRSKEDNPGWKRYRGPAFWKYQGKTLVEIQKEKQEREAREKDNADS